MTHITCRLTAKNRDQLRNPTLGNRVRATFYLLLRLRQNFEHRRTFDEVAGKVPLVRFNSKTLQDSDVSTDQNNFLGHSLIASLFKRDLR